MSNQVVKSYAEVLEKMKPQIKNALPAHLKADRFVRLALTEIKQNSKLRSCTQQSVLGALMTCSQLGLEPGAVLGQAYLIPYKDTCQFILGYKGMISLARRSGEIVSLSAHVIHENDLFEFEYGFDEKLRHVPCRKDRGQLIGAYSYATLKDGGRQVEVMWKNDIDKVRQSSKAGNHSSSPWASHYEEMAKKTTIRRLFKMLPVSIEMTQAITLDEAADVGNQSDYIEMPDNVIEGVSENVSYEEKPKSKFDEIKENILDSGDLQRLDEVGLQVATAENQVTQMQLKVLRETYKEKLTELKAEEQ